jgi:hypothetical protein
VDAPPAAILSVPLWSGFHAISVSRLIFLAVGIFCRKLCFEVPEISMGLHAQDYVRVSEIFAIAIRRRITTLFHSYLYMLNYLIVRKGRKKPLNYTRGNPANFLSIYKNLRQILLKVNTNIGFNNTCNIKQLNLPHNKAIIIHTFTMKN